MVVISPTDAASQEVVVGLAQRVVVARARAPRDAAIQQCLEYLDSGHPDFELEASARSVVELEGVLPEAAPWFACTPVNLDRQVGLPPFCTAAYPSTPTLRSIPLLNCDAIYALLHGDEIFPPSPVKSPITTGNNFPRATAKIHRSA